MPRRARLDAELVRRGLARSREHAVQLVAAGRVTADMISRRSPVESMNVRSLRSMVSVVTSPRRRSTLSVSTGPVLISSSPVIFRVTPDSVARLRKYSGTEAGYKPYTELLKQRELEQIAKTAVIFPSKDEVETELGRNSNYVDGIAALFKKYKLTGWEDSYSKLKAELADYDAWVRANILPKARTDFRLD